MKNWTQDPRELLPMHLKLRRGLQFNSVSDQVEASFAAILEPTIITQWQYRLMLSLNGERPLIEVVREVHSKFPNQFEAEDVWKFLDWMIDHHLIFHAPQQSDSFEEQVFIENAALPDSIVSMPTAINPWVRIPLQMIAILGVCLGVGFVTYLATPLMVVLVEGDTPTEEDQNFEGIEENARMPEMATTSEIELAANASGKLIDPVAIPDQSDDIPEETASPGNGSEKTTALTEELDQPDEVEPSSDEPDVVETLMALRQELVACQIRRDECYLLNEEKGYRKEVARISELAREIGEISAAYEEADPAP